MAVVLMVVGGLVIVLGLVVTATGRVPGRLNARVARPRLWGVGYALFGGYVIGLGVRYHHAADSAPLILLMVAGLVLMAVSLVRSKPRAR